jgi:uncharacterized CHY-type Zn-finger protein
MFICGKCKESYEDEKLAKYDAEDSREYMICKDCLQRELSEMYTATESVLPGAALGVFGYVRRLFKKAER